VDRKAYREKESEDAVVTGLVEGLLSDFVFLEWTMRASANQDKRSQSPIPDFNTPDYCVTLAEQQLRLDNQAALR
jgi:hypothetical protein